VRLFVAKHLRPSVKEGAPPTRMKRGPRPFHALPVQQALRDAPPFGKLLRCQVRGDVAFDNGGPLVDAAHHTPPGLTNGACRGLRYMA